MSSLKMSDNSISSSAFKTKLLTKTGFFKNMHFGMSVTAIALVSAFVFFIAIFHDSAASIFGDARSWIEHHFGLYYLITAEVLIALCFFIIVSPYGKIRFGHDHEKPEFGYFAWLSMLFSAGIGTGILFFGVGEPSFYFDNSGFAGYPNNPFADMIGATAMDQDRAVQALQVSFLHWGVHGWAIYAVVGMSLAYFAYRKNLPLAMRSTLHPFIGDRIYGPIGHTVDLITVMVCIFSVASALGLGVSQISVGIEHLFGIEATTFSKLALISLISLIAIASAISGVSRGIKMISRWNTILSISIVILFLLAGPTTWIINLFSDTLISYLENFIQMGLWVADEPGPAKWQSSWTIFYWGWWFAWSPFIGLFIARISRGRTLREFVVGTLFIPTVLIFIWLGVFGGSAIHEEINSTAGVGTAGIIDLIKEWKIPHALFANTDIIFGHGSLAWIISAIMVILLICLFITSADSSVLVLTTVLSFGNNEPPKFFRAFWGVMIALISAILLIAGGLNVLQTTNIAAALPVSILLIMMSLALLKAIVWDERITSK
ncbi:MAG: BCCT family transporter [Parashewanella sp.]